MRESIYYSTNKRQKIGNGILWFAENFSFACFSKKWYESSKSFRHSQDAHKVILPY